MSNITDLTGTTWYFNGDSYVLLQNTHYIYYLNFVSNNGTFSSIGISLNSSKLVSYRVDATGGATSAYQLSTGWKDEYRTITIIDGTDVTNQDLIEWLQANAIQVSMLVSSVQLPNGDVYQLKDAISGYITANNIKPGTNIIFTEDSEGNTVINSAGGGGGSSSAYVDQHLLVIDTNVLSGDEVSY